VVAVRLEAEPRGAREARRSSRGPAPFDRAWARADVRLTSSRIIDAEPGIRSHALAEKYADLGNGTVLQYVERGRAAGTPVILLHGFTDSWRSYERVLPLLPDSVRALDSFRRADFAAKLVNVRVPTLIVWGDPDSFTMRRDQDAIHAAIAGSSLDIYAGAGHSPHWEEPERFAARLTAFAGEATPR
jgi:pimeloyl-ACP methyl ester carboxylesterase